jgi:hypothetical protein
LTVYFAPIARLFGDLVVSLPPLQRLIASSSDDVCLVLRSTAQQGLAERIPGLAASISEPDFLRSPEFQSERLYNLRAHPLQTDFVWGSKEFFAKYPNYGIREVIRRICDDFRIDDGQNSLEPLQYKFDKRFQEKIVLIPGSTAPIKNWPQSYWLELHQKLKQLGKESVLIGEMKENSQLKHLCEQGVPWIQTPTIIDALDAISSCAGVVSVDTGLMHLAVHQGISTVALFREYSFFARDYSHAKNIIAPACQDNCLEGQFDFVPNANLFFPDWKSDDSFNVWSNMRCKQEERGCMSKISVDAVMNALVEQGILYEPSGKF